MTSELAPRSVDFSHLGILGFGKLLLKPTNFNNILKEEHQCFNHKLYKLSIKIVGGL